MSINFVAVSGNIGNEPELRQTASGISVISFSLAVNDRIKNTSTGEWTDYTNWINCVMFGKRAESLSRILRKGMKVALTGRLRYSSWENKEGQRRSKVEVIAEEVELMQRRSDGDGAGGYDSGGSGTYTNRGGNGPQNGSQAPTGGNDEYAYDDFPF